MGASLVRELVEGPLNKGEDSLTIMDVAVDGGWNLATLSFNFPNSILSDVLSTPLRRFLVREDMKSWISYLNGGFHPKNAYLFIVEEDLKVPNFNGKWLWKLNTTPPPPNQNPYLPMEMASPKFVREKYPRLERY